MRKRPTWPGASYGLGDRRHAVLDLAARRLHLTLGLATVLLHRAHGRATALAQLALHAGAGALDLAHRPVAGRRATALEALEARLDALADLLELTLGAVAAGEVRAHSLEDGVTRGERGTDRDEHAALSLRLSDLKGVQLSFGARLSGLLRRATARGSIAATGRSSLLGSGLALCLGALRLRLGLGLGSHWWHL